MQRSAIAGERVLFYAGGYNRQVPQADWLVGMKARERVQQVPVMRGAYVASNILFTITL